MSEAGDDSVLVCRVGDDYYAMSNICSHARVMLTLGRLRGTTVTCPLHGAQFDVQTGRCLSGPPKLDLPSYPVRREGDELVIELPG